MSKQPVYHTNYLVAVNWLNNSCILCNDIPNIDPSVWDNMLPRIDLEQQSEEADKCPECGCEEFIDFPNGYHQCCDCDHEWKEGEEDDEDGGCPPEIFQWYLTDCSRADVEYLRDNFGLWFTYSDALGLYILLVDHCGTGWDYVHCDTLIKNAERELGAKK